MKVCIISYEYPPNIEGGAGTYAKSLSEGLNNKGIEVFVITSGYQNDYDNKIFRVPTLNVEYWRRLFFMKSAISLLPKLNKLYKFHIIHFNEPHIIFKKINIPIVSTIHSNQFNEIKLRSSFLKNIFMTKNYKDLLIKNSIGSITDIITAHISDKIICPSIHLTKLIKNYCFVKRKKIFYIPNGINLNDFNEISYNKEDVLCKYNIDNENYLFFIGRLTLDKGLQYILKSFKNIKKDYPDIKLVIAGTGNKNYEIYLKKIANKIGNIIFTGHINSLNIKKILFKNCFAVVVPSVYEGLPMVILEAMASRKTVVASNVGGIPSLIKHGKNGFLIEPGDIKSLEKYIRILLKHTKLREDMGNFGRKMVEDNFTMDEMIQKTIEVYKSIY